MDISLLQSNCDNLSDGPSVWSDSGQIAGKNGCILLLHRSGYGQSHQLRKWDDVNVLLRIDLGRVVDNYGYGDDDDDDDDNDGISVALSNR